MISLKPLAVSLLTFYSTYLLFATNIMLPTLVELFHMPVTSVSWVTLIFRILFVGTGLSFIQIIRKVEQLEVQYMLY